MKKLMLSILAVVAIANVPSRAQAISGGAAAGIGVGAFVGGLVIAKAMCCCCKKKSTDKSEKKAKKSRRGSKAAAAA